MHGKPSLQKSMQAIRRSEAKGRVKETSDEVIIGYWRLREDDEGSLVIINVETGKTVTLSKK